MLTSVNGTAMPQVNVTLKLQRPTFPGYLDRPDFVRQDSDVHIQIDTADRWAEPIDTMFAKVLAFDLRQRLPNCQILTEDDATPTDVRFVVVINVQHFNQTQDGKVTLDADASVIDRTRVFAPQTIPVRFTTEGTSSPQSVADNLSRLVGELATVLTFNSARIKGYPNITP
jgi:uncharacterized lipoprotein YmbA